MGYKGGKVHFPEGSAHREPSLGNKSWRMLKYASGPLYWSGKTVPLVPGKAILLVLTLKACERPRLNLKTSTFIIVTHFPKPPDHVHAPKPPSSGNVQIGKLNAT